jgi:hypothetical protein
VVAGAGTTDHSPRQWHRLGTLRPWSIPDDDARAARTELGAGDSDDVVVGSIRRLVREGLSGAVSCRLDASCPCATHPSRGCGSGRQRQGRRADS